VQLHAERNFSVLPLDFMEGRAMKEMLYYVEPQDEAVELEYQQQCTITWR